ncbi:MAG: hypothetical protein GYB37_07080 [Algicola sp.]|nr:hypothetical protein [Algicola sp.]
MFPSEGAYVLGENFLIPCQPKTAKDSMEFTKYIRDNAGGYGQKFIDLMVQQEPFGSFFTTSPGYLEL